MAGEASMLPLLLLTWCTLCLGKRRSLLRHPTVVHWQDDPEGYVLSTDVESSPDADTPRPCGLALLLCMLERGPDTVAHALIALAAQLQVNRACPLLGCFNTWCEGKQGFQATATNAPALLRDRLSRW